MKYVFQKKETLIHCSSLRSLNLKKSKLTESGRKLKISETDFLKLIKKLNNETDLKAGLLVKGISDKYKSNNNSVKIISEILTSRRYRGGLREDSGIVEIENKISLAVMKRQPIKLSISLYPCKIPNRLKSAGVLPDLSDLISLFRLKEICIAVEKVYKPGAIFYVLADGNRFGEMLKFPVKIINAYQDGLRELISYSEMGKYIKLLDYTQVLSKKLPKNILNKKRAIFLNTRSKYYRKFGGEIDLRNPLRFLDKVANNKDDRDIGSKIISVYMSLLYCSHVPEIIDSFNSDELTLKVYSDIFNFNDDKKIGLLKKKIISDNWKMTINYLSEIISGRITKPIEVIYPDAIRCDIHNINDRLTLYPLHRNTKLTSFHSTGFVEDDYEISTNFRVILTSSNCVPVYGKFGKLNYSKQAFCYISPLIFKNKTKFDEGVIRYLKLK
jgi:hypothetical protein